LATTAVLTAMLYAPILIRTDLPTILATSPIVAAKTRPLPWSTFLVGNAEKAVDTWWRWASDRGWWFQALWLAGIAVALVRHRQVGRTRVPFVAGLLVGSAPILFAQRVVPPSRVWVFLLPVFAGMGAAGALHLIGGLLPRQAGERHARGLAIGLALLVAAGGILTLRATHHAYAYDAPEFPAAEQAVTVLAPQLVPGDKIVVPGLSLTPFQYHAGRHGLPHLRYVHDDVLEGWGPLRGARRVFVVMIDPRRTLARVLAEAQLTDAPPPTEIAVLEGGGIYLVSRD
jgi:hypothetical protein